MAGDGTSYEIAFTTPGADKVAEAAKAVDGARAALATYSSTATSAAAAVATAEARYRELEVGADKAAKALERLSPAVQANREAMALAAADGMVEEFWELAGVANKLAEQDAALRAAADGATAALNSQAAAVDALTAASLQAQAAQDSAAYDAETAALARDSEEALRNAEAKYRAAEAERKFNEALAKSQGALSDQSKAHERANKLAEFDAQQRKASLANMKAQASAYIAIGVAAVAAFTAVGVAVFNILKTTIAWADENKRLEKAQAQLDKNLKKTFGGLKIDKLLDGLDTLVALFDSSTASGRALKFLFETMFQPIVDAVAAAIPMVERLFLHAVILALKAYIALKPYSEEIATVAKWFAIAAAVIGGIVVASIALFIGFIALGIAIIVGIIAAIAALVGWLIDVLPGAWDAVSSAASAAWEAVKGAVGGAIDWLMSLSLVDIGTNLIMGLVEGIAGAAGAVVSAITGAVGGAIDAAKSMLGIASPSKVFAEIGGHTASGFAAGVDDGAGEAQSSLASMVDPTAAAGAAGGAGSVSTKRGDTIINITVNGAGQGGEALAAIIRDAVLEALESDT